MSNASKLYLTACSPTGFCQRQLTCPRMCTATYDNLKNKRCLTVPALGMSILVISSCTSLLARQTHPPRGVAAAVPASLRLASDAPVARGFLYRAHLQRLYSHRPVAVSHVISAGACCCPADAAIRFRSWMRCYPQTRSACGWPGYRRVSRGLPIHPLLRRYPRCTHPPSIRQAVQTNMPPASAYTCPEAHRLPAIQRSVKAWLHEVSSVRYTCH